MIGNKAGERSVDLLEDVFVTTADGVMKQCETIVPAIITEPLTQLWENLENTDVSILDG